MALTFFIGLFQLLMWIGVGGDIALIICKNCTSNFPELLHDIWLASTLVIMHIYFLLKALKSKRDKTNNNIKEENK